MPPEPAYLALIGEATYRFASMEWNVIYLARRANRLYHDLDKQRRT